MSLAICAGNSPVTGKFPAQRPVTHSFDVFFDLRLNKRLSKQLWGWWLEKPSRPLWRHCNVKPVLQPWVGWGGVYTHRLYCNQICDIWLSQVVEIRHWGRCGVPKSEIREKLADLYKTVPEVVICFGFRSQWGGGRTIGFALIYDSIDFAKKFEPKCRQVRVSNNTFSRNLLSFSYIVENTEFSLCQICRHCWHWSLSLRQHAVALKC